MSKSGFKTYWKNTISFTLIFALIATGGFGFFWSKMIYGVRASDKANLTEGNMCVNSLLLGVDKDGYRTDVIMFAQLNMANNSLNILQIPRDTYVSKSIADHKINSSYLAYENGRLTTNINGVYKAVEEVIGLKTDNYIMVDTKGFRNIIDAIGGVEFNVPIDMNYDDPEQDLHIHLNKGVQMLNGSKAEQLVRFRQNNDKSGYPRADLQRNEVQRDFIYAVIDKVIDITNIAKLPELIASVTTSVETNFNSNEILQYSAIALAVPRENIHIMGIEGVAENRPYGSYFIANDNLNKQLVDKYFIDDESAAANSIEISRRNLLLSDDENTIATDLSKSDASFIEKRLVDVGIIDGSGGSANIEGVKNALKNSGYSVKNVEATNGVIYNTSKIIANKDSKNINTICKILSFDKYSINSSKTEGYDILVVVGKDFD